MDELADVFRHLPDGSTYSYPTEPTAPEQEVVEE